MKRHWITKIATMAAILALSACALEREPTFAEPELPSAGDTVDLGVIVGGKLLDEIISDPEEADRILRKVLGEEHGGPEGRGELKKVLQALDRGRVPHKEIPALTGAGAFSTAEFARAILFPDVRRKTKGLIGDYLVFFDEEKKTGYGHLTVDMRTEIFLTAESYRNKKADRTERLQWHIDVVNDAKHDGFKVIERLGDKNNPNDPNYPNDPFPGTVEFPAYSLDPDDPRSIWSRELKYKLFAKGKGVVVRDVFWQVDQGSITRLPNGHPFYRRTDESCIDLMTRDFPPEFRIEFPEQSGYCLGRCAQPDVMNSM